ncbi:MAG: nicotinamidase-related amidase [bacterium]|jgi:nicotinamidase-related amidase
MNKSQVACVIIDLQNEFLSKQGMFGERHIKPNPIVDSNLSSLVKKVREDKVNAHLFWVYSEYDHQLKRTHKSLQVNNDYLPMPDSDFLSGSHFGKRPCCPAGSWNAEFFPIIRKLIDDSKDEITCKNWYSAFTETNLHNRLQSLKIQELWIAGVVTNVCVMATCRDAFFLGYDVKLLEDCTTATSEKRHLSALEIIKNQYGKILTSDQF